MFSFSQDMVTQASPYLFEATEKRFYFKSVAILIPEKWKTKPEYVRPKLETYKNVRISSSFFQVQFPSLIQIFFHQNILESNEIVPKSSCVNKVIYLLISMWETKLTKFPYYLQPMHKSLKQAE